jgi:hypothetical protein
MAMRSTPLSTDVRLGDGLNGWDVAEAAQAQWPDIRVVYTSGNMVSPGAMFPEACS